LSLTLHGSLEAENGEDDDANDDYEDGRDNVAEHFALRRLHRREINRRFPVNVTGDLPASKIQTEIASHQESEEILVKI